MVPPDTSTGDCKLSKTAYRARPVYRLISMRKNYYWRLIAACTLPLALNALGQSNPNGNPGDWTDLGTLAPAAGVFTLPFGGPSGGGFTVLHNSYPGGDDVGQYSWFGSPPPNPGSPGPSSSGVIQSIAMYLNPLKPSEQSGGLTIDMVPNATTDTPQYGTPQLWGAEEEFNLSGSAGGINAALWYNTPIATITKAGWYDFVMNFAAGAPTAPVTIDLSIYDLSAGNSLVGSVSTAAVDAGPGTYLSENLDGSGYVWLTEWYGDFGCNRLAVADVNASVVPDGGNAMMLLGASLSGLALLRRRFGRG